MSGLIEHMAIKIKLLEDVLESNNQTITMLKNEVKRNKDDIEKKDEAYEPVLWHGLLLLLTQ